MVLLVDAANVVGSRPDGWWRDRPGAARALVARIRAATCAHALDAPVVVVLEGDARRGVPEGSEHGVDVVHATADGDAMLAHLAATAQGPVLLVSSDRGLADRVRSTGGDVVGAGWLLHRLDGVEA